MYTNNDMNEEEKTYEVELDKLGVSPIAVTTGTLIHIICTVTMVSGGDCIFYYGTGREAPAD